MVKHRVIGRRSQHTRARHWLVTWGVVAVIGCQTEPETPPNVTITAVSSSNAGTATTVVNSGGAGTFYLEYRYTPPTTNCSSSCVSNAAQTVVGEPIAIDAGAETVVNESVPDVISVKAYSRGRHANYTQTSCRTPAGACP